MQRRSPWFLGALGVFTISSWPTPASAQQSLFNVPAGTNTLEAGTFFQEQFNCGTLGESNTTVEIGLPLNLEVGLNLLHVDVYGHATSQSARSILAGNIIWTPRINNWLTWQVGTALGAGHDEVNLAQEFTGFGWTVFRARPFEGPITGVLGAYLGSSHWLGPGWPVGPLAGFEVELWPEHLLFMGDFVVGNHEQAVGVFGPVVFLPFGWQLSLGFQVPSPGSTNEYEGVIELTHVPSAPARHGEVPPEQEPRTGHPTPSPAAPKQLKPAHREPVHHHHV